MNTKKFVGGLLATALVANMAIAGAAMASEAATGTLELEAGSLTLGLSTNAVDLGTLTVSTSDQNETGITFPDVDFGDLRSDATVGFTLTMTATDLDDGSHTPIGYANIAVRADDDNTIAAIGSSDTTGVSIDAAVDGTYDTFSGSGATSDAKTLVSATTAERVDEYQISPLMEVTVPAGQPSGTYTSTLTLSIQ